MSDEKKLELARAIHGTPHATRTSFTPTQWSGVERAWAWVEKNYQPKEPTVKQFDREGYVGAFKEARVDTARDVHDGIAQAVARAVGGTVIGQAEDATPPPWTEAQREAARNLYDALCDEDNRATDWNERCAVITKFAPMFFVPDTSVLKNCAATDVKWSQPEPPFDDMEGRGPCGGKRCFRQVDGNWIHSSKSYATCSERKPAPSPAPAGVPTPVSCPCSKCGHGRHEHDRYGSCLASGSGHGGFCACGRYEDKDGASVPGDSGLKSGHNMERGSGCPASDHHADRETSTPHAPKEQAPSHICGVAPWPNRIELARLVRKTRFDYVNERDWHGEPASVDFMHADAALTMFSPALRTRDERIADLEQQRDNARRVYDRGRDAIMAMEDTIATLTKERDEARAEAKRWMQSRDTEVGSLAKYRDELKAERDAALARVAELEKRGAVDVEACAHEINQEVHGDAKAWFHRTGDWWFGDQRIAAILRKHTRDVRRITKEEQAVFAKAYNAATGDFDGWIRAGFRAIGFEVEA